MTGYAIIIEQAEDGGFGAWSPDLPGCVALADTEAETLAEMKEVIALHIESLRDHGEPIPQPTTVSATTYAFDAA